MFYLLSGYVMTMLIEKYYKHSSAIPTFYLDRAARLFPQILFYMVLASVFIHFFVVIWAMQRFFSVKAFDAYNMALLLLASSVLALGSFYFVERPALRWRHASSSKAKADAT